MLIMFVRCSCIFVMLLLCHGQAHAYDIKSAIKDALKESKRINMSHIAVDIAEKDKTKAQAGFMPRVTCGYSAMNSRFEGDVTSNGRVAQLSLQQNVYNGLSSFNNVRAAKMQIEIDKIALAETESQVVKKAISTYSNVLLAKSRSDLKSKQLHLSKVALEEIKIKHKKGVANGTDLAEAYAQTSAVNAQVVSAEGELLKGMREFQHVFGVMKKVSELKMLDTNMANKYIPAKIEKCYALALENNFELRRAKDALQKQRFMHKSSFGELMPAVNVSASVYGLRSGNADGPLSPKNNVRIGVDIPLFQIDAIMSNAAMKKRVMMKEEEMLDTELAVKQKVFDAWQDYRSMKEMLRYYEDNVRAKEGAMNAMKIESSFGTKTIRDLLRANTDLFESQVQVLEGKKAIIDSALNLLYLLGELKESVF